jgi:RNA polymerase sigma-70 factor (ECF subfamily)
MGGLRKETERLSETMETALRTRGTANILEAGRAIHRQFGIRLSSFAPHCSPALPGFRLRQLRSHCVLPVRCAISTRTRSSAGRDVSAVPYEMRGGSASRGEAWRLSEPGPCVNGRHGSAVYHGQVNRTTGAIIRTVAHELIDDGTTHTRSRPADLEVLFRTEGDGVYRTLYAFTGGRADVAEEATAEAFARAVARQQQLRDPLAWIYRVAFRVAIDELRRDRRRGALPDAPTAPPDLAGLMDALRKLSPNQRAAIVLRYVLDLDVDEVAKRMGVAAPTVRVHTHRGKARLRELLGSEEVD